MIPVVNPSRTRQALPAGQPWISVPLRALVAVLALVAAAIAGYLTWTSLSQGVVAGCDGSGLVDCDDVLGSVWSRWLGLPVALGGLVSYLAILVLAALSGLRAAAARGIATLLAMLAILAVASGIWFTLLQVFVLGKFCPYCMGVHACGLLIAAVVLWSAIGRRQGQLAVAQSHVALAAALPTAGTRRVAGPHLLPGPSLAWAAGGATLLLALLVGGQFLFPPETLHKTKVALAEPIEMTATAHEDSADSELSPSAQAHTVNRLAGSDSQVDMPAAQDEQSADTSAGSADEGGVQEGASSTAAEDIAAANPAPVDDSPKPRREVTFLEGKLKIDLYTQAVLGSPEARYVIIELMDYTCPHCRKLHKTLRDAERRYGDQLAIVIMPVPLELECNKRLPKTDPMHRGSCRLARLALSVAEINPRAFIGFHSWLLADEEKPPSNARAVLRAFSLVDREKLSELSNSQAMKDRVQKYINLLAQLTAQEGGKMPEGKSFGLPVQIVGDLVLSGGDTDADEIFAAWEEELGIEPL